MIEIVVMTSMLVAINKNIRFNIKDILAYGARYYIVFLSGSLLWRLLNLKIESSHMRYLISGECLSSCVILLVMPAKAYIQAFPGVFLDASLRWHDTLL